MPQDIADVADVYFAPGQFLDLSIPGNVAKFISAGKPVDLGSDGSTPTGIAPLVFLSGDVTMFVLTTKVYGWRLYFDRHPYQRHHKPE
jgi:hypothetical protein